MTTELTLAEIKEISTTLSASKLMPEALQKSPADIFAIVKTGQELGLEPMKSIRGIAIIKGKPTLSADLMGALVKRERSVCEYLRLVESTDKVATYETKRVGEPGTTRISFTSEDAARAGLAGDNWRKYPAQMLRARALSGICRAVYPDLLLGVYAEGELDDSVTVEPKRVDAAMVDAFTKPADIVEVAAQRVEAVETELKAPPASPPRQSDDVEKKRAEVMAVLEASKDKATFVKDMHHVAKLVNELPPSIQAAVRTWSAAKMKELEAAK